MIDVLTTELRPNTIEENSILRGMLEVSAVWDADTSAGRKSFNEYGILELRGRIANGGNPLLRFKLWSRRLLDFDPDKFSLATHNKMGTLVIRDLTDDVITVIPPTDIRLFDDYRTDIKKVYHSGYMLREGGNMELGSQWYTNEELSELLNAIDHQRIVPPKMLHTPFVKVDPSCEGNSYLVVATRDIKNPRYINDMIVIDRDNHNQLIPRVMKFPFLVPSTDSVST